MGQSRLSRRRVPTTIDAREELEEYCAGMVLLFRLEQCRVGSKHAYLDLRNTLLRGERPSYYAVSRSDV